LIETIIVLANDELVNLFLLKKISFTDISVVLQKLINMREFKNYYQKKPGSLNSIMKLNKKIRIKINKLV